jgi:hypothetical protein
MLRISLVISLFALAALFGFLAPKTTIDPGVILVGGEYTVQPGETRNGDMVILFGQFNVENGGTVTGNVYLVGSGLDIKGTVTGEIYSYGGDVKVVPSTQTGREFNTIDSFHRLPRLPSILMVIS